MSTRYGIPYNFFFIRFKFLTITTLLFIIIPFLEIKIGLSFKNDINNLKKKKNIFFLSNINWSIFFLSIYSI